MGVPSTMTWQPALREHVEFPAATWSVHSEKLRQIEIHITSAAMYQPEDRAGCASIS